MKIVAAVSVLALLLYAALPWLIPTRWIAGQLHLALSELTGRPVRIERVSIGWRQGIVIEGLTIARKAEYGDGQLVRIGRAHCGFTPLHTLFSGQVDRLEIHDADCWAVIGKDGRLNLTDLGGAPSAAGPPGRLPTQVWQFGKIRLHLVSDMPDQQELVLDFGSLACRFDPTSGEASYSADATLAGTAGATPSEILWDGKLSVPSLNPNVSLAGGTEFRFSHLDLSSLPAWVWPKALGVVSVTGASSGRLATSLDEREGMRFNVDIKLEDVTTRRRDTSEPDDIGDLSLDVVGGYRADTRAFQLRRFSLDVPKRVSIRGPQSRNSALTYAPLDREWLAADFQVTTPDVSALAELSPLMALLQERQIAVSGPGTATVSFAAGVEGTRWSLDADLTDVRCIAPQWYHHAEGEKAALRLVGEIDGRDESLVINDLTLDLGEDRLHLQARLPGVAAGAGRFESEQEIISLFERGDIHVDLSIAHAEQRTQTIPVLARVVGRTDISGPIRAELDHRPSGGTPRLDWRVTLPESFRCIADPLVHLSGGVPVAATGQLRYPDESTGTPGQIGLDIRYGEARVHVASDESAWRFAAVGEKTGDDLSPVSVDFHARVPVEIERIESLLSCAPWVSKLLAERAGPGSSLSGHCRTELTLNAAVTDASQTWRLTGSVQADSLRVQLGDWLRKSAREPARIECGFTFRQAGGLTTTRVDGEVALSGIQAAGWWTRSTNADDAAVAIEVADVTAVRAQSPALERLLRTHGVSGTASVRLDGHSSGSDIGGSFSADVTGLAFEVPGRFGVTKRAGVPLSAAARVVVANDPNDLSAWQLDMSQVDMAIGGSRVAIPALSTRVARRPDDADGALPGAWNLQSAVAHGKADVMIDGSLLGVNPQLDDWIHRYDCAGRGTATFSLDYADGRDLALEWRADGTRLHVNALPTWIKPAGTPIESRGRARLSFEKDAGVRVVVERLDGQVGDTSLIVRGDCVLNTNADSKSVLGPWSFDVQADCVRLDEWTELIGPLRDTKPTGGAIVHVGLRGDALHLHCHDGNVHLDNAAFVLADKRVWFDGDLAFTPDRVSTSGLRVRVGDSDVAILGAIDSPLDAPAGDLLIRSDRMDADDISEWIGRAAADLPAAPSSPPSRDLDGLWRLIDDASIEAHLHAEKVWFTEPTTRRRFLVDELHGDARLADGVLSAPVRCLVNGGVIDGSIGFDRTKHPALFLLDYKARDVQPLDRGTGVDVRPYLALTFPGLEPTGPITLIDSTRQRLLDPVAPHNHPVGSGELIIEGGVVSGKAAPDYITQLFPKLDFARFEFTRMHDWFEKFADGRVEHHFVFRGPVYHIYADGVSSAGGRIRYEVGVDFLASFDKESWAKTGQGRLPLFIKEGSITADGRLANEQVRYVPLWKLANTIFVSNNIIETSYLALREQLRRSAK